MIVFWGRKIAKIKSFTDHHATCPECHALGVAVTIHQTYHHVYLIPMVPGGDKVVSMHCLACGTPIRHYEQEKIYAAQKRSPVYLYTWPILLGLGILSLVFFSFKGKHERNSYVANPQPGDVYLMHEQQGSQKMYYFMRVFEVNKESVSVHPNSGGYNGYVSAMQPGDKFMLDEAYQIPRKKLAEMLEQGEIDEIERP